MTLKFEKVIDQVQTMGRMVGYRTQDLSQRGQRALQLLGDADDLDLLHEKIDLVREKDAGYRGAAPYKESINQAYACSVAPNLATLIAVDGSQVYPDIHASALYYLLNIGTFTYFHGTNELPREDSEPELFYTDVDLRDRGGHGDVVKNAVVNARRDVKEIQALTTACWGQPIENLPIIGIRDGRLLWWLSKDVPHFEQLEGEYHQALQNFYEIHLHRRRHAQANASLIGYVESEDSRFVVRLLHLLDLHTDQITRAELETSGQFEGLTDGWLFGRFLQPRERSAVMIQQSPQNKGYKFKIGNPFEIAFFYINVGTLFKSHIIRVELPIWVADADGAVDEIHSLILSQTELTGAYPYVLTRADELATVTSYEKSQLVNMINIELLKNAQDVDKSPKQVGKDQTRGKRSRYTPQKPIPVKSR